MKSKTHWTILLVIASLLFIYGLFSQNIIVTIVALVIAIIVQKMGSEVLFKDFDRKQEERLEKLKQKKTGRK